MSIEYSNTLVENCLFINNETNDWFPGGAIYIVGGRPTIRACEFIGNVSDEDDGGAIAIRYGVKNRVPTRVATIRLNKWVSMRDPDCASEATTSENSPTCANTTQVATD